MTFFLDAILLIIIAICIFVGTKKGFFKAMLGMGSTVVAIILTYLTYRGAADYLNEKVFLSKVTDVVRNSITSNGTTTDLTKLFEEKNDFFTRIINRFSDMDSVEAYYDSVKGTDNVVGKVSSYMAGPLSNTVSKVVGFIVVFLLILIILKIISAVVGKFFDLPVLKQLDGFLGLLTGALIGIFIAWVLSMLIIASLNSLIALVPNLFPSGQTVDEIINSSIILKAMSRFNISHLIIH